MIWLMLISFLLDGILSSIFYGDSLFLPLFSIIILVVTYPYMMQSKKKFLIAIGVLGLLYDVVYTNTFFLYVYIFILIGLVVMLFYRFFRNQIINTLLIGSISIILFRSLNYFFLVMIQLKSYHFDELWQSIYQSFILNGIYLIILYGILKLYSYRQHKKNSHIMMSSKKNIQMFAKSLDN